METSTTRRRGLALAATAIAVLALPVATAGAKKKPKLSVDVVSSRADVVTAGNALVEVDVPKHVKPSKVKVDRDGKGVTRSFDRSSGNRRHLVGLVQGLRNGSNLISARAKGARGAKLTVLNSPVTGPVISGPHQSPFICTTEDNGLGPATDSDCSAPSQVSYEYRSTDGSFKPLSDPSQRPADLATTTTRDGQTVPYVVRVEAGVINRSIYRWAILDPSGDVGGSGWNRRLIFSFGGGCSAGYQQGKQAPSVLDNRELSEGYAVMSSSLTVLNTACNDVLSAETASMVKEHVIETIGEKPVWTIGDGSSGGSVQVQMIAQNYPGILDGLLPSQSFPDNSAPDYPDCRLLNNYFQTPDGSGLSNAERNAITGLSNPNGCVALSQGADVVNASEGCVESIVPPSIIFDANTNPNGIRCTLWDSMVNVYGRDPATGYARRTLDNAGVQYGLDAFKDGVINAKKFLDLNDEVGGFDNNGIPRPQRSVADEGALAIAYRTGRINQGAGGVPDVPIIDAREYVDNDVNVHQYVNTYKFRARLQALNGTYANQVMFRAKGGQNVTAMHDTALDEMGQWLDALHNDNSDKPMSQKVIDDKPGAAVDGCWINGGQRVDGPAIIGDNNVCENTYPPHSLPANEAGKPLDSLVAKCQLKPIDFSDYPPMTSANQARLQSIFPDGVCDWSKPGNEQQKLGDTWQYFGAVANRSLKLKLKGGRKAKLEAKLRPCPAGKWQRVDFERRRKGKWKQIKSAIAEGGKCTAKAKLKLKNGTKVRAEVHAIRGYAAAHSSSKRV